MTIRLYVLTVWVPRQQETHSTVVRAYTAEDAITQWRALRYPERKDLSCVIEPIEEDDPRLQGWKYRPGEMVTPSWFGKNT